MMIRVSKGHRAESIYKMHKEGCQYYHWKAALEAIWILKTLAFVRFYG